MNQQRLLQPERQAGRAVPARRSEPGEHLPGRETLAGQKSSFALGEPSGAHGVAALPKLPVNLTILGPNARSKDRGSSPRSFPSITIFSHLLATAAALLLAAGPALAADDWPQWRGPHRNGLVSGPPWPDRLDAAHLRRAWEVPLDPSYSGPVIAGEKVFTTQTKDKQFEAAIALDRRTGRELWRAEWEGSLRVPFFARANGDWIRSTPAFDGQSLYVAGMRDVLVCLDAESGRERWRFDFAAQLKAPLPDFGFVSSPLVDSGAVYVQAGAGLCKLDKATGELAWRVLHDQGGMWGSAFSSPVLADLAGRRQLVVQTRAKLAGVDPDRGEILWEQPVEAFRGMNILTPVVYEDVLFTSTYGGRSIGFKVSEQGGRYSITELWRHKAQGYMTTPVLIEGVAYTHLKSQRAMAIEAATGRELWTSGRSFGKYWSLAANAGRILALDQAGQLFLFQADRERFQLLDERKVASSETWAHVAVAGSQIFIRELNGLSAWQWSNPPAPTP